MTFALERSAPAGVMATRPAYQRTAAALASRLAQVRHVKIMRSLNGIASRFVQTRVSQRSCCPQNKLVCTISLPSVTAFGPAGPVGRRPRPQGMPAGHSHLALDKLTRVSVSTVLRASTSARVSTQPS
jgi:hypothetical protein